MAEDKQVPAKIDLNNPHPKFLKLGFDLEQWQVCVKQLFPGAKSLTTIAMVAQYCKVKNLDLMSKPFHIVPMYKDGEEVDTIWPSVTLYEIQAHRTGEFAGVTKPIWGEVKEFTFNGFKMTAPESCTLTVKRKVKDVIHEYTVELFFEEFVSKASEKAKSGAGQPNKMWKEKPRHMLAKCALAAALRLAFPEAIGSEPSAEEMEGKETMYSVIDEDGTETQVSAKVMDLAKPAHSKNEQLAAQAQPPKVKGKPKVDTQPEPETVEAEAVETTEEPAKEETTSTPPEETTTIKISEPPPPEPAKADAAKSAAKRMW